jgi:hypothetical protein
MAEDAGIATVASLVVNHGELLEDNWPQALFYQRPGGRGPHGATANDRYIEPL